MKASWYAEALVRALQGGTKKTDKEIQAVIARFHEVVKARGHEGFLKMIPRELARIAERDTARSQVTLVTADTKSRTKWAHAYDHYEKEGIIPEGSIRNEIVDETIVGGFQIKSKDILIDASYKKSLAELYRNIINNK